MLSGISILTSRLTGNIPLTASQRNGQSDFQNSEPPTPTEGATFAARENAKIRNGLSRDQFLRHLSFPYVSRR
jgi:hypothetical protein